MQQNPAKQIIFSEPHQPLGQPMQMQQHVHTHPVQLFNYMRVHETRDKQEKPYNRDCMITRTTRLKGENSTLNINKKICQKSSKLRDDIYWSERGNESQTPVTDTDSSLPKERVIDGQYEGSSQTINNVVSKGFSRGTMEETKKLHTGCIGYWARNKSIIKTSELW